MIYFACNKPFNDGSGEINVDLANNFGQFIGGVIGPIFSLAGFLLLYETIIAQRQSFEVQQFETRFFELIRLHKSNLQEFASKNKTGVGVFISINNEFHQLYNQLVKLFEPKHPDKEITLQEKNNYIQTAYLITFFGVNNSSTNYLKTLIQKIVTEEQDRNTIMGWLNGLIKNHKEIKEHNRQVAKQQTEVTNLKQEQNKSLLTKKYLKYDGHQALLGVYFRHLFQTISYVNIKSGRFFSYSDKYNYIKTLRAQLSTHEQAIFLFNSLSTLGFAWELEIDDDEVNDKLITKYNLIKNLPVGFTKDINPRDYFPDIFFESDDAITPNRAKLKKKYK